MSLEDNDDDGDGLHSFSNLREEMLHELERLRVIMNDSGCYGEVPLVDDRKHDHSGFMNLREEMLFELARLREIMGIKSYDEEIEALSAEGRRVLDAFLECFSTCPTCKKENHENYLLKFFFSKNPENIAIKEKLTRLVLLEIDMDIVIQDMELVVGIPCCDCFNKFF